MTPPDGLVDLSAASGSVAPEAVAACKDQPDGPISMIVIVMGLISW